MIPAMVPHAIWGLLNEEREGAGSGCVAWFLSMLCRLTRFSCLCKMESKWHLSWREGNPHSPIASTSDCYPESLPHCPAPCSGHLRACHHCYGWLKSTSCLGVTLFGNKFLTDNGIKSPPWSKASKFRPEETRESSWDMVGLITDVQHQPAEGPMPRFCSSGLQDCKMVAFRRLRQGD